MSLLQNINTEKRNANSINLDSMSIANAVDLMISEEYEVINALKDQSSQITNLIEHCSVTIKNGGRIIYVGAGTSGRIGILDAVECIPTFSVGEDVIVGLIAGGEKAFVRSQEGAEDKPELGQQALEEIMLNSNDIVIGIAASGRTPYVIGALEYANKVGATTGAISCSKNAEISKYAKLSIEAVAGPEVLTGSTRLKSGTVQKLILNMVSTISMVSIGKVYQNLMVDVNPSNQKLVERSKNIIIEATGVSYADAEKYFYNANESVKVAIVMILNSCDYEEALAILKRNNNFIR